MDGTTKRTSYEQLKRDDGIGRSGGAYSDHISYGLSQDRIL